MSWGVSSSPTSVLEASEGLCAATGVCWPGSPAVVQRPIGREPLHSELVCFAGGGEAGIGVEGISVELHTIIEEEQDTLDEQEAAESSSELGMGQSVSPSS